MSVLFSSHLRSRWERLLWLCCCAVLCLGVSLLQGQECHAGTAPSANATQKSTKTKKKVVGKKSQRVLEKALTLRLAQRNRRYRRYRRYRRDPYYYRTHNPRRGFLIAGIVMTSVGYGLSLMVGLTGYSIAAAARDGATSLDFGMLMVPVAGPFITWGILAGRQASQPNTYGHVPVTYPWLGILGLAQGLGVAFIILGATGKRRRVPVYSNVSQKRPILANTTKIPAAPPAGKTILLGQY